MVAVKFMMPTMIPGLQDNQKAPVRIFVFLLFFINIIGLSSRAEAPTGPSGTSPGAPAALTQASCLSSGDGYLKARLKGSIDASVDWPNAGTRCEGEERPGHGGLRLSFRREPGAAPDLLFVFGLSRVGENQSASGVAVNVTVILQGSSRIFGTQGDSRCTIDSLRQTRLTDGTPTSGAPVAGAPAAGDATPRRYRVEARGFCTGPAHAVRGEGSVLLTTFDFAGSVTFDHKDSIT